MKRTFFVSLGVALALFYGANAAAHDINVEAAKEVPGPAPLSLPLDDHLEDDNVMVEDEATGRVYPATVRNGQLTFIVPEGLKKGGHTFLAVEGFASRAPGVELEKDGNSIFVSIDGLPFTAYRFPEDGRKPYLWPVLADGETGVTRDWPMVEGGESRDHVHQKSMWTAYGDVNGVDTWGEAGSKAGYQTVKDVSFGSGDAYGWIVSENVWEDGDHKPLLDETREYRFYSTRSEAMRFFDVRVTFTASYGDVKFGDTKEGGIFALRIRPEMQANKKGVITNALGGKGEKECWGKAAAWCDYSGAIEGVGTFGAAVFDHPDNLRHPTRWHVRNYGLMGANCFGLSYFVGEDENGDYTVNDQESLTFNYRVYFHHGNADEAKVAEHYALYANPPQVSWAIE